MNSTNSKLETIQSLISSISNKYKNQIDEINKHLIYKHWIFPNDYQKQLTIIDLKDKIEKYNLIEIDPRSLQDYVDMYNENEWFKYFPVYNQAGKMIWNNDKDVLNIIESFLKTGAKNNARNIYDYLSKDNNRLNTISSAIVWNKLDYIARTVNNYSYKADLYNGIYEDGNLIGSLARNNKDESLEVICLSNILSTIKSFISGTISNDDILGINAESLKACCNLQFNRIDIKNITCIMDFWNANVGKKYTKGFEEIESQKDLSKLKQEQKIIENDIIDAIKLANFSNSNISICNMNQNIAGSILSLGNSNVIKLSQTCNQTNSENIENNVQTIENTINNISTKIETVENTVNNIQESSFPYIVFDIKKNIVDNVFEKYDNKKIIAVIVVILLIILAGISFCIYYMYKHHGSTIKSTSVHF